jgi:ADP-heptose:LPS heptosyltransferase
VKKKILLVRLDKIGDLICTLPVDQVLDEAVYDVTWVIQKGLNKILDLGEKKRKYIELDKNKVEESRALFSEFLKNEKFDVAISFQCPWWVNFEIFKARIAKRIGVLSQWHSFLFLNQGIRQRRSEATQHEFDYNLDLVKKLTGPLDIKNSDILFKFKKPHSSEIIEKYNLKQYVVVHPGMMGSALNWPQHKYIEYIQTLVDQGLRVVVTGTDADTPYLLKIRAQFESHPQVTWLQSKLNFEELIQVLYYSQKVIAPSTGVAHIAAALDKDIHAIFSPLRVHHPRRWAPRGHHVHIYLPVLSAGEVPCSGVKNCKIKNCKHKNCMENITL